MRPDSLAVLASYAVGVCSANREIAQSDKLNYAMFCSIVKYVHRLQLFQIYHMLKHLFFWLWTFDRIKYCIN